MSRFRNSKNQEEKIHCKHQVCIPFFDKEAAIGLSIEEVESRWPKFSGVCPKCKAKITLYASLEHFLCSVGQYNPTSKKENKSSIWK